LTETSCFWRLKQNEEDDGDLRNDCVFILFLTPEPIKKDFYNTLISFRCGYLHLIPSSVRDSFYADDRATLFSGCSRITLGITSVLFVNYEMASLLKKMVFINPIGELVDMNIREKLCADYDIYNIWNFQQGFGLKVPTSTCSVTCNPGFRKLHQEQRADCCFDCVWCPENEVSNETNMEQCMSCQEDQYSNTEHTHCLQRHVSFLTYEDPLGMTLACISLCFSALTVLVLGAFVKYKDTPIVKANNRILSYILLISITFCFLCSLLFIGHPNIVTCILQQTTFGVFFTVAVSTVLAKTITVVLAFKLTTPGERLRGMLVSGAPKFVIPICTVVQLILCGIWMVTSPPFIDTDTHSEHGQIIIVCNKGSVIAFHFVLGYLGSLALGSFTVAFLARNLPDRFNEAKFLTFSMLVFCSVWVTFLPVYHSIKGKFIYMVYYIDRLCCYISNFISDFINLDALSLCLLLWSILEKVPWGAEKKQKDGPCFHIHSVNLCLFIVGKIFFNDFVEYVFCAFELVFFSFFYPYYSKDNYIEDILSCEIQEFERLKYVLNTVDTYSRLHWATPMNSDKADSVIKHLLKVMAIM
ncbi:hypothetical protein STEG23_037644, partial [Scotinomys teguina]